MNCQTCGANNPTGSHFCASCGTSLPVVCLTCGSPLLANAQFCNHCGAPAPAEGSQTITTIQSEAVLPSPFQRIRARSLALWVLVGIPPLFFIYVLASAYTDSSDVEIDPFFDVLIFSGWLYGLLVAWGLWKMARNRVDFGSLIGRIPLDYQWRPVLGMVALLIVFSLSAFWLFLYWLAVNIPDAAEIMASGELFATSELTQYAGLYNAEVFIVAVFIAPVVEEFIFRGLLLTRWSFKWGTTAAILGSSLVFALLHADLVGAFAFGVVMSLLYIRTGTLLVPMAAHALNNLIAVGLSALVLTAETDKSIPLVQDLESGLMTAIVAAIVTLPVLLWYVIRNWPRRDQTLPYFS